MQLQSKEKCAPVLWALLLTMVWPTAAAAKTWIVRSGENLQAVLNAAAPGDAVTLEPGAEFVGNFVLPAKVGDVPIVLRTAASDQLPGPGHRIEPGHAPLLARLRSANTMAALRTAAGAHHWELRYLEFGPTQGGYNDIIQLGDGSSRQNTLAAVPHHLVLSHLYVHGDPLLGQKRCIALNAANVTIRDSHISDCKGVGMDTQAIGGWNGPGPYVIENNFLEAAGENILFGGADPAIQNLVADGITVRRNYVTRPLEWRQPIIPAPVAVVASAEGGGTLPAGSYSYRVIARRPVGQGTIGRSEASAEAAAAVDHGGAVRITWHPVPGATEYRVHGRSAGKQDQYWTVTTTTFVDRGAAGAGGAPPSGGGTVWSVKNLFELKNARNVVVEENIFEHHWKESQAGYSIVLTPRNSGGACTWCVVERVRFERNIVRRVAAGVNLLGYDIASRPTRQTNNIVFRDNLFHDVGQDLGGNGWVLLIGDEPRDVVFDHNTVSHSGTSFVFAYGGSSADPREMYNVRITNNAVRHSSYGVNGNYFAYGSAILNAYFPGSTVSGNYFAGGPASRYPAGNRFAGAFEAEFVDAATGDFRLRGSSQLIGAANDGKDIGADMGALLLTLTSVVQGSPRLSAPGNLRVVAR
jgi:hypothetical protein